MLSGIKNPSERRCQGTLKRPIACEGVGVHTGQRIRLVLSPAPSHKGVVFVRTDQKKGEIKAHFDNVVDTRFSTTLGNAQGLTLSTVEHLMAAFSALGVDNARVEVDGPEVPILDGSAQPFVHLIQQAGVTSQKAPRHYIKVLKPVRVENGDAFLEILPAPHFCVSVEAPLGAHATQSYTYTSKEAFTETIAPARTFSLLKDVEKMQAAGLIKGGSLENAVVLDGDRVINPEGLRFPEECARHKILDIIGDFALAGQTFRGHIRGKSPGHTLNHLLLKTLMHTPRAWRREAADISQVPPLLRTPHPPVAVFASSAYNEIRCSS